MLVGWAAPDERQGQLRDRFLAFLDAHGARAVDRDLRIGHVTASTLLLDDARERTLLTLHPLIGGWVQLGGHVEPGERSLVGAALREAVEESGIDGVRVDPAPIGLDVHPVACRDGAGLPSPSAHYDVTHLGIAPAGAEHRRSAESLDLAWFPLDALPDTADDVVRGLVSRARAAGRA